MHNKPKYTLFKNTSYALSGLKEVFKNESSFKLQVVFFFVMASITYMLPFTFFHKLLLFIVLFLPLMSEIANSAIERVVDLVTTEYHELAKQAKDAGAALVFMSFVVVAIVWLSIIYIEIFKG